MTTSSPASSTRSSSMNENFYALVEAAARGRDSQVLLESETGSACTHAQAAEWTGRIAALLVACGAKRGDRVAVQVEKSPLSLFLYLACLRAGLVYLPLNSAYQRAELTHFIADAEPAIIVCRPQSVPTMRELSEGK